MKLSVVIPTYCRADILKKTLQSLNQQSIPKEDFEVIVVDDGSQDNGATKSVVEGFHKLNPNFKYIWQENQKQGIARNNGIQNAKGQIIVLLGDDIIPANKDFLNEHLKFHEKYPEENSGVLGFTDWAPSLQISDFMRWLTNGSCVLGKFGGHQFAYEKLGGDINGKDSFGYNAIGYSEKHGHKELADFNFFYTSNISIKKSLLEKEKFDTDFSEYGWEDIELGYRLEKKYNFKLYYNPNSIGWHDHVITEDSLANRMRMIAKSAAVIDKKYPELKARPSKLKQLAFKILGCELTLQLFKQLSRISANFMNYYYYGLSKKYYLEGLENNKFTNKI